MQAEGIGTHFILFDYAVRLERFSPSEGNLLLECVSLDGLLRNGAGNWTQEMSKRARHRTDQSLLIKPELI